MNVSKEQTTIAGSQFRTKNKQNQNRNDHAVFCMPKEKLFPAKYLLSILQYRISCKDKRKKTHTHTKNNLAASAFTETLALLIEEKVNNP